MGENNTFRRSANDDIIPPLYSLFIMINNDKLENKDDVSVTEKQRLRVSLNEVVQKDLDGMDKLIKTIQEKESDPNNQEITKRFNEEINEFVNANGLENGQNLANGVHPSDKKGAGVVRKDLISEFSINTASGQMLIDLAVNAYFRNLRTSRIYMKLLMTDDAYMHSINQLSINLIKQLGRQIDMSNQQVLALFSYLHGLHRPPLNVKIHTQEAYIAQNQQNNQSP